MYAESARTTLVTYNHAMTSNHVMASAAHTSGQARQLEDIRLMVDTVPTLVWSARPDGSAEFFNQRWLDYTGLSSKQALGSGWEVAIHPDDLNDLVDYWRRV